VRIAKELQSSKELQLSRVECFLEVFQNDCRKVFENQTLQFREYVEEHERAIG
jgi:hypothetical protein